MAYQEGATAPIREATMIHWPPDPQTAQAANAHPISLKRDTPAPQFAGCWTEAKTWNDRVIQPAAWPAGPLRSSPDQIISFFRDRRYTQGLAMVVSWGGMGRRSKDIYGEHKIETIQQIERALQDSAKSILESQSVADSWKILTGLEDHQLGWSAVIASKTLHFLCRALGFQQNPPVAIDGACIRNKLWPTFRNSIPFTQRPADWEGNSFEAYCRYMTTILTWANQRKWTTTQMEATMFDQFQ